MTLEQAKDKVAKDKGYPSWDGMYNWIARDGERPEVVAQLIEAAAIEAAELYASSKLSEAQETISKLKWKELKAQERISELEALTPKQ